MMAQIKSDPALMQQFKFQSIQILKDKHLGSGSYGTVCQARCDELLCAAKIVHSIFFQCGDPGENVALTKFEQECQFLRAINHPNVVQYLGTMQHPDTGHPVLLMELMDETLTRLLKQSQYPLPYHVQVDLCTDVALALAYLHSNGIAHRDLSSNNVLLLGRYRAKVTDFGMTRLLNANPRMTSLTQCPGTMVYMAPEALKVPPVYTTTLDCFSHGVLAIQIMTRKFPDPGPHVEDVLDETSPVGIMQMPIKERERRKSHIDTIDPNHPLLQLALKCLSYKESERPSARDLCNELAKIKEDENYTQSLQKTSDAQLHLQEKHERLEQLSEQLKGREIDIAQVSQQLQEKHERIEELSDQLKGRQSDIAQVSQQLQEKHERIEELSDQLKGRQSDIAHVSQQLQEKHERIEELSDQLKGRESDIAQVSQQLRESQLQKEQLRQRLEQANKQIEMNDRTTAELQQALAQKSEIRETHESTSTPSQQTQQQSASKRDGIAQKLKKALSRSASSQWRKCLDAPRALSRGSAAVCTDRKVVYIRGSNDLFAYEWQKDEWEKQPECPKQSYTLAVVNGLLTAVGGDTFGSQTSNLLSLTGEGRERKWVEHFPPMPTKRAFAAVISIGKYLLVIGGEGDGGRLTIVEVMNIETRQWFAASSLPNPRSQATATICGDNVYLVGGYNKNRVNTNSVFTCSLTTLLQFCQVTPAQSGAPSPWSRLETTPVFLTSCVTFNGQLVAVGGCESDGKPTSSVYAYEADKRSWCVISRMNRARSRCLVAVSGDTLLVIGGYTSSSSLSECASVEVATAL